ncbi:uncharacterized protein LOC141922115 isoform X2 [Strix aluco]|uniref:uncharacterized protein LOC141922115 isoform X2 n=1 Tax=Strix aluco TaxID=111821 RepID=UPI003DA2AAD9
MLSERGRAEAALVCSCPGVLLTAPTSGLCEVSLPGLALLTAQGQKGTGGALPGCGQRTGAAAAEAGETRESGRKRKSRPSVQHPPPSAGRESLPLCVRKEPSSQSDRQRAPRVCVRHPKRGTATQATGVSEEEEGQEEGRRKKHLTRQILPAVPRTRAAFQSVVGPDDLQEFPSHLKPFCSSGVTAVTSRAVSYHRREKVAPGFKAIPSACCFTPATALLKKRRRKLWLTKLCHNRDCSRQHHGMLIMTSTGLAVLSFSLLLAVDLQWSLIRGKRLYNSKWSYKAAAPEEERRGTVRSSGLKRGAGREKGALDKGASPLPGLRSHKTVAGTFGALAGAALGDLPVSRARVSGLLPPFPTV